MKPQAAKAALTQPFAHHQAYECGVGVLDVARMDLSHNSEHWTWRQHRIDPVRGTPELQPGQEVTFEGVNQTVLKWAGRYRLIVSTAMCVAVYLLLNSMVAGYVLSDLQEWNSRRWILGSGFVTSLTIFTYAFLPIAKRVEARGVRKVLQLDAVTAMRHTLYWVPLSKLPGQAVRGGAMWQLGLGRRLRHLSPEAREALYVLADETDLNLEHLTQIAQQLAPVTNR